MATLSVLKFDDPYGAERVMIALQGMQEREMITLEDAAVVSWPQGNRKPTTHQLRNTAGAGATWGAFWGFLFGLIFFVPFLGAAIGAGMGGMTGASSRRRHQRRLRQAGPREGHGGNVCAVRPDQWSHGGRQGCRRAEGITTSRSSRPTCQRSRSRNSARPSHTRNSATWPWSGDSGYRSTAQNWYRRTG